MNKHLYLISLTVMNSLSNLTFSDRLIVSDIMFETVSGNEGSFDSDSMAWR